MNLVQLGGLLLTVAGVALLIMTVLAWLVRGIARLARRPLDRWDGFYARWPARFVILGVFGMALGYGMMWGPSLVMGAKTDRAEKERRFQ
ncbi:hypothetical protein [Caulobacter mirabilis]|uniref:Uncharacterized protein n=1 Tax=Caulobacter mirabilis TaxID=69666 RepID=A0A2D2AYU2_9CAUL|nr:hypothetical protein [Caulobacter mirabilis]ATQ43180.1 hypothetical protein CSW64_12525 [Caulobacter mirabilis]